MWGGEAHVLAEGRTRSFSNSRLAAARFSGERRRGQTKTGQPSVTMGLETPCFTGLLLVQGVVKEGNSARSCIKGSPLAAGREMLRQGGESDEGSAKTREPFLVVG